MQFIYKRVRSEKQNESFSFLELCTVCDVRRLLSTEACSLSEWSTRRTSVSDRTAEGKRLLAHAPYIRYWCLLLWYVQDSVLCLCANFNSRDSLDRGDNSSCVCPGRERKAEDTYKAKIWLFFFIILILIIIIEDNRKAFVGCDNVKCVWEGSRQSFVEFFFFSN